MVGKYIKKITLYDKLIKLKPLWVTHIAVVFLLLCEMFAIAGIFIWHNEEPTAYFIIDYLSAFTISHFFAYIIFAFLLLLLFFSQILIKILFKKNFITQNNFLLNNKIYHIFWVLGTCITIVLTICAFIYILIMIKEGLVWLYHINLQ